MSDLKRMTVAEFRALGFMQEVNRLVLHPIGLALEATTNEDGSESINALWDCRDDPEGIRYERVPLAERAAFFEGIWRTAERTRLPALGYMVQPPLDDESMIQ